MKKGKLVVVLVVVMIAFSISSCKKCHECHYDKGTNEIELGEYCGDDLEEVEKNGFTDTSGTYEVHCHEH